MIVTISDEDNNWKEVHATRVVLYEDCMIGDVEGEEVFRAKLMDIVELKD